MTGRPPAQEGRSPGMEALAEAMRLEQARIYGQLCKEHPQSVDRGCGRSVDGAQKAELAAIKEDSRNVRQLRPIYRRRESA